MLYVIVGTDVANSLEKRLAVRELHLQRLQKLQSEGALILAGPLPAVDSPDPGEAGFSGSVIIAEFPNLDVAKQWANEDPYLTSGVYESVMVKPFKKVLP